MSYWRVTIAALLVLATLSYAPVRDAGLVHEDQPPAAGGTYDPIQPRALTALSWRLQADQTPRSWHAANLAIHLTNGALLSTLLPPTPLGLLAVGLFLLHPINSEAVDYLSARADLWLGTTILLALLAARISGAQGMALLALALLACWQAKESGVVAVALVALWQTTHKRRLPWAVLALGVLAGGYVTGQYLAGLHTWIVAGPSTFRFLELQAAALWRMALLVMVPWGFTIEHDWQRLPDLLGLTLFLLTIALGVLAWQRRSAYPRASFALLWSLLALAPRWLVSVPHGAQEHHFYAPLLGLWLAPALESR